MAFSTSGLYRVASATFSNVSRLARAGIERIGSGRLQARGSGMRRT